MGIRARTPAAELMALSIETAKLADVAAIVAIDPSSSEADTRHTRSTDARRLSASLGAISGVIQV